MDIVDCGVASAGTGKDLDKGVVVHDPVSKRGCIEHLHKSIVHQGGGAEAAGVLKEKRDIVIYESKASAVDDEAGAGDECGLGIFDGGGRSPVFERKAADKISRTYWPCHRDGGDAGRAEGCR